MLFRSFGPETNFMMTTGNHDYYNEFASIPAFREALGDEYFANDVDFTDFENGSRHCVVKGYNFIFVEPIDYRNYCEYEESTLTWLDAKLAAITAENPDKYVFVFTHPPVYGTAYGSEVEGAMWTTKNLGPTLAKYPQVLMFAGHSHFPINDERSIMQTEFTSVGCGAVRYVSLDGTLANGGDPKNVYDVSTGHLVQVDADGNVRITRMNFSNGTTIKTPWVLSAPMESKNHLTKYRSERASENSAPVLTGTVTFTPTAETATTADGTITVPAAIDDDMVHHYIIDVVNVETGATAQTMKVLSDFAFYSKVSEMSDTLRHNISLSDAGQYRIDITAVDSWGAKSNKLSCTYTVGGSN